MGLRENIMREPVSRLDMNAGVLAPPSMTVRQAVRLMRQRDEGCAIVIDDRGKPLGKFTEHALANLLANRPPCLDEPISLHVRHAWAVMRHSDPIATLIHKLQDYRLRWVIVVDDEGSAIGVIGQRALMEYLAEHFPRAVKAQRMESTVTMETREGA